MYITFHTYLICIYIYMIQYIYIYMPVFFSVRKDFVLGRSGRVAPLHHEPSVQGHLCGCIGGSSR